MNRKGIYNISEFCFNISSLEKCPSLLISHYGKERLKSPTNSNKYSSKIDPILNKFDANSSIDTLSPGEMYAQQRVTVHLFIEIFTQAFSAPLWNSSNRTGLRLFLTTTKTPPRSFFAMSDVHLSRLKKP